VVEVYNPDSVDLKYVIQESLVGDMLDKG